MTPPLRGTQENSGERARNLSGTAMRMLRRLAPMRFTVIAILALSVSGIAIAAISPRILGHATDLIFDGVIGAFRNFELNDLEINKTKGRLWLVEKHGVPMYDELVLVAKRETVDVARTKGDIGFDVGSPILIANCPDFSVF